MFNYIQIINESEFNEYLFEGLDINLKNKTVTFTDSHENLVDTSGQLTYKNINGIKTYMLFKRKRSNDIFISDGNPLVYSLKNINGWRLTNKDKLMYRIRESLKQLPKYDIVIMVPSSNMLMKEISKFITYNGSILLEKCLIKKSKQEVIDEMDFSEFIEDEIEEMRNAFEKMGNYFESKHFPKNLLSKLKVSIFKYNQHGKELVNKDILIIDDTISTGYSLTSCSKTIQEQYFPKSITQFSLFSDLK